MDTNTKTWNIDSYVYTLTVADPDAVLGGLAVDLHRSFRSGTGHEVLISVKTSDLDMVDEIVNEVTELLDAGLNVAPIVELIQI